MARDTGEILEALYSRYERMMFSIAYSVLGSRPDAEDAVHQSFCVLISKLQRLDLSSEDGTRALLMIVVKNTALNMLRSRKRVVSVEDIDDASPLLTRDDLFSLHTDEIRDALSTLPEEIKHIVMLRFVYGFSVEETSELTGLSIDAVYRRIRRARFLLKKYMEV